MSQYKAAVIGLGNIGLLYDLEPQRSHPSTHVLAYEMSPMFDLVCGIDEDERKKRIFFEKAPNAKFYNSLDAAVDSGALTDIDVISICTPPDTHLGIVSQLLDLGIGRIIFCEKPIVSNLTEVEELRKMLDKNTKTIVVPNISRRWNRGLRRAAHVIESGHYGKLEIINFRYTRGIENTGAHLFDLLKMWSGQNIRKVYALSETATSALPEPSYSFYFELERGTHGYGEAIDDRNYYMFDVDFYFSQGKIEMRNSGDDVVYYTTGKHHLFDGFKELVMDRCDENLLADSCLKNAIVNIGQMIEQNATPNCTLEDAIYPLYVAEALRKSYKKRGFVEVEYV